MFFKKAQPLVFIFNLLIPLSLGISGCGSSSSGTSGTTPTGNVASVSVSETSTSGDFTPSVSFLTTDSGSLGIRVAAVDVNGDGTVGTPSVTDVTVASGDQITANLAGMSLSGKSSATSDPSCTSRSVGSGDTDDKFDIAVSLDTTSSMGAAAGILASKVSDFATALAAAGVDAQFAGITVGDAFATKEDPSTLFTDSVSTGLLGTPPSFDTDERPATGNSLITAANMATFFDAVETAVGSGAGGTGLPENYLGSINYVNSNLSWRSGAGRVIISIGDNCAHTPDTDDDAILGDSITATWAPPNPTTLEDALKGVATVHVVGNTEEDLSCTTQGYYNPKTLATATGGTFTEIGDCSDSSTCTVNLTTLPISSAITSGIISECGITLEDLTTITVTISLSMVEGSTTSTATFIAVLNVTAS